MTEEEYLFIRQMEIDHRDVLRRMSNIENMKNHGDIIMLHADLISIVKAIQEAINSRKVKSLHALDILNQMKFGFIEMLAQTDELMS
jgi:hypothetical protein